jgi:hypothetical protein
LFGRQPFHLTAKGILPKIKAGAIDATRVLFVWFNLRNASVFSFFAGSKNEPEKQGIGKKTYEHSKFC